jgi:hypothetical protein
MSCFEEWKIVNGGVYLYLEFFNTERYHQALGDATPDKVYFSSRDGER